MVWATEKTVDYIEAGHQYFQQSGFAVLRIDIDNHGDRKKYEYDFDLTDGYRYWTRDIITQTVFDLRRSIDFLEAREEIDAEKNWTSLASALAVSLAPFLVEWTNG